MGNYVEIIIGFFTSVIAFSIAALVVNVAEAMRGKSSLPNAAKYWIGEILAIALFVSIATPFFYACWKSVELLYSFNRDITLYSLGCSLALMFGTILGRRA